MTPDGTPVVAVEAEVEDVAVTLDSIAESIDAESEISNDRHDEILKEVRGCQEKLAALQQLMAPLQAESPSVQQLLAQMTGLQASIAEIKADLQSLRESKPSTPQESVEIITPSESTIPKPEEGGPPEKPTTEENSQEKPRQQSGLKRRLYVKV